MTLKADSINLIRRLRRVILVREMTCAMIFLVSAGCRKEQASGFQNQDDGWHGQAEVVEQPQRRQAETQADNTLSVKVPSTGQSPPQSPPVNRARIMPQLQPRLGEPLAGLSPDELERFRAGRRAFGRILYPEDGLGPIHNLHSCIGCHSNPTGGSGTNSITMFGRVTDDGHYSDLAELGGPLLQAEFTNPDCAETIPEEANVVATRLTSSVLGGGLIEAIPAATLEALAAAQAPQVRGRVHLMAPGVVGKFGFKAHIATLLAFSGKATRDELGLTNRFFPEENAPNGDLARATPCDALPDPEIRPDASGLDFVDRITDFQRLLAPPPQTPRSGLRGQKIFEEIGCAECHTPVITTDSAAELSPVLRQREARAYSDFLLHDMGDAGDGIQQDNAQRSEMRTTPLWGFRIRFPVFHDGRVTGQSMRERATGSISWHRGQGTAARDAFNALSPSDQDALVAFLDSLGRVEFDADGDNDIDVADVPLFSQHMNGPAALSCNLEEHCAIVDVDQSGTVDLVDFALLQRAFTGPVMASAMVVP